MVSQINAHMHSLFGELSELNKLNKSVILTIIFLICRFSFCRLVHNKGVPFSWTVDEF